MKKLIPILLAVFALASCEKDPDMGKLDDNYLVYTNYDKQANFKDFSTFYLADKILVISDSKNRNISKEKALSKFWLLIQKIWKQKVINRLPIKKVPILVFK